MQINGNQGDKPVLVLLHLKKVKVKKKVTYSVRRAVSAHPCLPPGGHFAN